MPFVGRCVSASLSRSTISPGTRMLAFTLRFATALAAALALAAPAAAQTTFTPQIGQAGKDVIWVPTPDDVVDRMLRMAQTTANDFVVDLGSGDGKIVIVAAKKFGARSMG